MDQVFVLTQVGYNVTRMRTLDNLRVPHDIESDLKPPSDRSRFGDCRSRFDSRNRHVP